VSLNPEIAIIVVVFPFEVGGTKSTMYTVSRSLRGAQARCVGTDRGPRAGQRHMGVSWKAERAAPRSHDLTGQGRHRSNNVPAPRAGFPRSGMSETREVMRAPVCEGNRSGRASGCGSRSGLIVAVENRVTNRREPVSSKGVPPRRRSSQWRRRWGVLPQYASPIASGITPPRANPTLRRTGCVNCARPGLWGSRRATAGTTRRPRDHGTTRQQDCSET